MRKGHHPAHVTGAISLFGSRASLSHIRNSIKGAGPDSWLAGACTNVHECSFAFTPIVSLQNQATLGSFLGVPIPVNTQVFGCHQLRQLFIFHLLHQGACWHRSSFYPLHARCGTGGYRVICQGVAVLLALVSPYNLPHGTHVHGQSLVLPSPNQKQVSLQSVYVCTSMKSIAFVLQFWSCLCNMLYMTVLMCSASSTPATRLRVSACSVDLQCCWC